MYQRCTLFTVSLGRLFTIKRSNLCVNCKKCERNCPVEIEITSKNEISDINCIRCHACVSVCPVKGSLKPVIKITRKNLIITLVMSLLLIQLNRHSSYTATVDLDQYSDTIILTEGIGKGFKGDISLTVVYENDKMIDIVVTEHFDTQKYFDTTNKMIEAVIKNQSTTVDTIAGATYSSKGIQEAIASAIETYESQ